ncbi:MAG: DNA replication and repair protein RecF [Actinomycetes bacterium]|jgi:DNA replication and repair protein RecF|nr:DNA replication and repair protein RecF [Actinomycetes bacterium]
MSYIVKSLTLKNFRSYDDYALELDPNLTILTGPNATGKTNLLEALELLTTGRSFRRPLAADLLHIGSEYGQAHLYAQDGSLRREVTLFLKEGKRSYEVNTKPASVKNPVAGPLPCVIFTPSDLRIIKDSAEKRRDALDELGQQLSGTYRRLRSEYGKILVQRNRLLKENIFSGVLMQAWTDRLVRVGAALYKKRLSLFNLLVPHIKQHHSALDAKIQLHLSYRAEWMMGEYVPDPAGDADSPSGGDSDTYVEDCLMRALAANKEKEHSLKRTAVGPHRDDVAFTLDGKDARTFGSQGQQRSIALAWKLAEINVIEELGAARPLLLLDDVMSELDGGRRARLAGMVGTVAQTVITTAHIDYFEKELLGRAKTVTLPPAGGIPAHEKPVTVA